MLMLLMMVVMMMNKWQGFDMHRYDLMHIQDDCITWFVRTRGGCRSRLGGIVVVVVVTATTTTATTTRAGRTQDANGFQHTLM